MNHQSPVTDHQSPRLTALVPVKGHSARVPGKNLRLLGSRPLVCWILDALSGAESVARIFVDTDSDQVHGVVARYFPEVTVLRRPERLWGGHVTANPLIEWELSQVAGEHFLQTHATNPFVSAATIDSAAAEYFAALKLGGDSLFAVRRQAMRLYDERGQPFGHHPQRLEPTQAMRAWAIDTMTLYYFSRRSFYASGARIGRRPRLWELAGREAVDIDDEFDWQVAAALAREAAPCG